MKRLTFALLLVAAACKQEQSAVAPSVAQTPPPSSAQTAAPPAFVHDPHSYARPDEVRVTHLALDLDVDFAKKQLAGTAALTIQRTRPNASTLTLDTHDLAIQSVALNPGNVPAQFALATADPILGSKLTIPLQPATNTVVIRYASSPGARALQWLEPAMTAGKKQPFLLSQSEAILARTWVPLQDSPQVRFTYEATIRVPHELMAVMSAENVTQRSADGVYHFTMPQPVPSYLMALGVGDLAFRAFDGRSGVYAEVPVIDAASREFSDTPKMIGAAEQLYGPYRWGRYDLLVLPPSFPYGGMENPRLTFLTPTVIAGDKSLVSLIAHELAHSWSGNLVTNATWNDFWLNEGFTTYFEHRITEALYGREYSEMLWLLGLTQVKEELPTLPVKDQALYLDLTGRDPDDAPDLVYEKGALFLRLLEEKAGRARWDQFLRGYFDAHAFQSMTTTRFIDALKQGLPDVVQQVKVEEWIYGPGLPANCPQPHSEAFAKVEAAAKQFASGGPASAIDMTKWSSHERQHFVESLPSLTPARMGELDARFHFTDSGNSEVLFAWLMKSVEDRYKTAYPAIERFLTSQGRRKFVKPLYAALWSHAEDRAFAKEVYAKARASYHPVTQSAVDDTLK
ncbi:MAG: M1 family metallopeptidase [Acidobacteria bacterium]|nr:M1 family metallopeptidase [Acidobacteriota bacterium]MBV9475137.1 M1 family metallopeptidase [Acidobacteriota bacterium]